MTDVGVPDAKRYATVQEVDNAFYVDVRDFVGWEVKLYKRVNGVLIEIENETEVYTSDELVYSIKVGSSCWGTTDSAYMIFLQRMEISCDDIPTGPLWGTDVFGKIYPNNLDTSTSYYTLYDQRKSAGDPFTEYHLLNKILDSDLNDINTVQIKNIIMNNWGKQNIFDYAPTTNSTGYTFKTYEGGLYKEIEYLSMPGITLGGQYGLARRYIPHLKLTFKILSPVYVPQPKLWYYSFIPGVSTQLKFTRTEPYITISHSKNPIPLDNYFITTYNWFGLNANKNMKLTTRIGDFESISDYDIPSSAGTHTVLKYAKDFNELGKLVDYAACEDTYGNTASYVTSTQIVNHINLTLSVNGSRGITNSCAGKINETFTISVSGSGTTADWIKYVKSEIKYDCKIELSRPGYFNGETIAKEEYLINFDEPHTVTFDTSGQCDVRVIGKMNNTTYPILSEELIIDEFGAINVLYNNEILSGEISGSGDATSRIKDIRLLFNNKKNVGEVDYSSEHPGKGLAVFKSYSDYGLDKVQNKLDNKDLFLCEMEQDNFISVNSISYRDPNNIYMCKANSVKSCKYYTKIGDATVVDIANFPDPKSEEFVELDQTGKAILSKPNTESVKISVFDEVPSTSAHSITAIIFEIDYPFNFDFTPYINALRFGFSAKCDNVSGQAIYFWDDSTTIPKWISVDVGSNVTLNDNNTMSFLDLTNQMNSKRIINKGGTSYFCIRSTSSNTASRAEITMWYFSMFVKFANDVGFANNDTIYNKIHYMNTVTSNRFWSDTFTDYSEITFRIPDEALEITGLYLYNPNEQIEEPNPNLLETITASVFGIWNGTAWLANVEVNKKDIKIQFNASRSIGRDSASTNIRYLDSITGKENIRLYPIRLSKRVPFYVTYSVYGLATSQYTQSGSVRPGDFYVKRVDASKVRIYLKNNEALPMLGYDDNSTTETSPTLFVDYSFVDGDHLCYTTTSVDGFVGKRIGQGIDVPPGFPIQMTFDLNRADEVELPATIISTTITGIGCDAMPFRQYLERHLTSSDADVKEDKEKRFRLDLVPLI